MKLGVQNNGMLPEGLVQKAKYLKEVGVECFEVDGQLILSQFEEVQEAAKIIDIKTVCGGYRNWIGSYEQEQRDECISDIKQIIDKLDILGGGGIVVPAAWALGTYRLPKMHPTREPEETVKVLSDSLKQLDEYCEGTSVKIYLEPLNRYQDFMINTLADAVELIEKNNLKNTLITADIYHMNIEEDNMIESISKNIKHIGHIHIAENHRYEPGTGSVDFKAIFNEYKKHGFKGCAVLECRFRKEDKESFEKSIAYLKGQM